MHELIYAGKPLPDDCQSGDSWSINVLFLGLLMKDLTIEILKQMKHSNMMPRSCDV